MKDVVSMVASASTKGFIGRTKTTTYGTPLFFEVSIGLYIFFYEIQHSKGKKDPKRDQDAKVTKGKLFAEEEVDIRG